MSTRLREHRISGRDLVLPIDGFWRANGCRFSPKTSLFPKLVALPGEVPISDASTWKRDVTPTRADSQTGSRIATGTGGSACYAFGCSPLSQTAENILHLSGNTTRGHWLSWFHSLPSWRFSRRKPDGIKSPQAESCTLAERTRHIEAWGRECNDHRPQGSLGYVTPSKYVKRGQATVSEAARRHFKTVR